jgi:glycosyltransferase involved in cell wall biosynthesis
MKASVIIIDYKRKKYILDALKSIKNQKGIDLNDIEVIVVKYYQDEKIDNYIKENFPNYKIINLDPNDPDHYVGRNYSEGIKVSSSNLIFILDDDDMFTENKISRIFEIVKNIKDEEYMIAHRLIPIDINGNIIKESKSMIKRIKEKIFDLVSVGGTVGIIFHTKNKDELVEYLRNIYFVVDNSLMCYFKTKGKIIKIKDELTYYRRHNLSASTSFSKDSLEKHLKDFIYIYERLKCKRVLNYLIGLKMELNTVYNTNYKISIKEYIQYLTIIDSNIIKRITHTLLYIFFRDKLRKYYLNKYNYIDLENKQS